MRREFITTANRSDLIAKAREIFPAVFDDGDRIRIFPTAWIFETETVCHTVDELRTYITEELEARAFEDYMLDYALYDGKYNDFLR